MRRFLRIVTLYAFQLLFARPILHGLAGVRYRRANLLPQGPCIVVSNHNSHLDAALLMTMFPLSRLPKIHPVAAADYFGKSWFMRLWAMGFLNAIPIERKPTKEVPDPLAPITERLRNGETLIFFPEGSRGEAGVVARFRPGVGRLVRAVPGLLVVPVFMSGPERIWPRGNVVPVPMSIDVHVGKPRTYSADADAKVIANLVRDDVLALAPPPPPEPGRKSRPPIRVAVCGIDEERNGAMFWEATRGLGQIDRTLGIGHTVIESGAAGFREASGPVPVARNRAMTGMLASLFGVDRRFGKQRFVQAVEREQVSEALAQAGDTRFAVVDGSVLVDLVAWFDVGHGGEGADEADLGSALQYVTVQKRVPPGKWWRLVRRAPEIWLINIFDLVRPPVPDLLVYVKTPVPEVMRRLRSRGGVLRPRDNEVFYGRLQSSYERVVGLLRKRRNVEVLELDTSSASPEQMAEEIYRVCRGLYETAEAAARQEQA